MISFFSLFFTTVFAFANGPQVCGNRSTQPSGCEVAAEAWLDERGVQSSASSYYSRCTNDSWIHAKGICKYRRSLSFESCPEIFHTVTIDINTGSVISYETNQDDPPFCAYPN